MGFSRWSNVEKCKVSGSKMNECEKTYWRGQMLKYWYLVGPTRLDFMKDKKW